MLTCDCGGCMVRHSIDRSKLNSNVKIRYRCRQCLRWESIWHDSMPALPTKVTRGKGPGRPAYIEERP